MHIAAVGWIYVTLMMAITEETVVAGIMTFFFYGVLPGLTLAVILNSVPSADSTIWRSVN